MTCIIPGCQNDAEHNLSVRCRRPDTTAIWAPNTEAFLCDDHATQGLTVQVLLIPNDTHTIETQISATGGQPVTRITSINQPAQPESGNFPLLSLAK